MKNIYMRKINSRQCINKSISIPQDIFKFFFEDSDCINIIGKKSGIKGVAPFTFTRGRQDPRFGGDFKKILKEEGGGDFEIGDILVVEKAEPYIVSLISENSIEYGVYNSYFYDDIHSRVFMDNELKTDTYTISFSDFYTYFKDIIDSRASDSTSSHMKKNEKEASIKWMKNYFGNSISSLYISDNVRKYGNKNAKDAYVELFKSLYSEENNRDLLQKYLFNYDRTNGLKKNTQFYEIEEGKFLHTDCMVIVYMFKSIKLLLDLDYKLDEYTFVFEIDSSDMFAFENVYDHDISNGEFVGTEMIPKERIERIKDLIKSKGYTYEDDLIKNFYLSLKSKPFVILAGTSGTGKTKLVQLFAEAIGAKDRCEIVSVRPDWSDGSDLLGHKNLQGDFVAGKVLEMIHRASQDEYDRPYFLCLDEMNLARVEYYFSDFLSKMETREYDGSKIVTAPLMDSSDLGDEAYEIYGDVIIPDNLYIIGTVNMDETTFPFSKKVLDRANTIEFSKVSLDAKAFIENVVDLEGMEAVAPVATNNAFLKTEFLNLKECVEKCTDEERKLIIETCEKLEAINKILEKADAHVGYRIRDEICFYMVNNMKAGLIDKDVAMDYEIMQKILPRIQGSSSAIRDLLCELFAYFEDGIKFAANDDKPKKIDEYVAANKEATYKYDKTVKKILFMIKRFVEDGFTSYWL